ncbi:hypothetical protein EPO14_03485 [Patescibacteria group bacterium]|nr:MAG: hypothetical protein EPO14_03485 [Patescibacteria group bacterium]
MGLEGDKGREAGSSALLPYTKESLEHARREGAPFAMVVLDYEKTEKGHRMTVPAKTEAAVTSAGRKEFEHLPEGKLWMAGGLLLILKCKDVSIALVRQRDSGAPSYPEHWTLGSGMPSPDDVPSAPWKTAAREGIEEFIIATADGVIQPVFNVSELDAIAGHAVSESDAIRTDPDFAHLPEVLKTDWKVHTPASFFKAPTEEEVEVVYEDGSIPATTQSGVLAFDPKASGVDFLKIVEVDMSQYALNEVSIFDGETHNGKSLNGADGCLKVTERVDGNGQRQLRLTNEFVAVYKDGVQQDLAPYQCEKMTVPLATMFKALNGEGR